MKKILLSVIFAAFSFFLHAQYKQQLDTFATIDFPFRPSVRDTAFFKIYSCKKDYVVYNVFVADLTQKNIKFNVRELDNVYKGYIKGILGKKDTLLSQSFFEIDGLRGVNIECKDISQTGFTGSRFYKIFFANNTIITAGYWVEPESADTSGEQGKHFLESFKLTKKPAQLQQYTISELESGIPFRIGEIFGYILVMSLLVWLVVKGIKLFTRK
ncbi:MAG: hypothetical protein J0I41_01400 [Filimonas sp.]|nr:hypothetical protein [Filimonas sp.]